MRNLKTYQISFWLKKPAEEILSPEGAEPVRIIIRELGGEILKEGRLGKSKPAYLLKRESEGLFGNLLVSLSPEKVALLKEKIKHEAEIMRLGIYRLGTLKAAAPQKVSRRPAGPSPQREEKSPVVLEDLEKKLEEILKA